MQEEGYMDDDTGRPDGEKLIQTESVGADLLNSPRFAQSRGLNEGIPASALAVETGVAPAQGVAGGYVDTGPPIPAGRGGMDALQEAAMIGVRAARGHQPPSSQVMAPEPVQSLQEAVTAPRKVLYEDKRPPLVRKVTNPKSVIPGDIVEHKDTGVLGKVVESTKRGMKVKLSGIGLVEVKPKQARNYKLVGRGV